jgi:hypothetical protein
MKPINTIPIEVFLEKVRIASRTNQKTVSLDIKDAVVLCDTMSIVMTRLVGRLTSTAKSADTDISKINADGGGFG